MEKLLILLVKDKEYLVLPNYLLAPWTRDVSGQLLGQFVFEVLVHASHTELVSAPLNQEDAVIGKHLLTSSTSKRRGLELPNRLHLISNFDCCLLIKSLGIFFILLSLHLFELSLFLFDHLNLQLQCFHLPSLILFVQVTSQSCIMQLLLVVSLLPKLQL